MQRDIPPAAAQALSQAGRGDGEGAASASRKGLNETATPTGCSLPLCGKGNVNEPKEDGEQAAGYIQTAKDPEYGGVRIPGTGLQTVVIRFSNLTHHPQRFKQTNSARHLIQLCSCEGNSF